MISQSGCLRFGYANEAMVINQWQDVKGIKCDELNPNCFSTGNQVIDFLKMKPVS